MKLFIYSFIVLDLTISIRLNRYLFWIYLSFIFIVYIVIVFFKLFNLFCWLIYLKFTFVFLFVKWLNLIFNYWISFCLSSWDNIIYFCKQAMINLRKIFHYLNNLHITLANLNLSLILFFRFHLFFFFNLLFFFILFKTLLLKLL